MRRAAAVLVMVLAILGGAMPRPAGAVTAVNAIGTIPRIPPAAVAAFGTVVVPTSFAYTDSAGTMLPVPSAGQLWQVYPYTNGTANTGVLVRDEATLAVITSFVVPDVLTRGAVAWGGEWMHATDAGARVFLVGRVDVFAVDLTTFAVTTVPFARLDQAPTASTSPARLSGVVYDPVADDLVLAYSGVPTSAVAHVATVIQRVDLSTSATTSRPVRACNNGLPNNDLYSSTYATPILLTATDVYLPCLQRTVGFSPVYAVVAMPLVSAFDPLGPETVVTGTVAHQSVLVDPTAGRFFILTWNGALVAFDTATMTTAWTVPVGAPNTEMGAGWNPTTGEVYVQSTTGFHVVDGTAVAAPVPFVLAAAAGPGQERIVSQSGSTHVYVLPGTVFAKAADYTVYEVLP